MKIFLYLLRIFVKYLHEFLITLSNKWDEEYLKKRTKKKKGRKECSGAQREVWTKGVSSNARLPWRELCLCQSSRSLLWRRTTRGRHYLDTVHFFWFAHPRKSLAGEMDVLPDVAEILNSLFLSCQPLVRPPNTFLPVVGLAIRMVGNHVFAFISF